MIRINLLPGEEKPSKEGIIWQSVFIWALIACGIIVFAGIGMHIFRSYEIRSLKSDIAETKLEQQRYAEAARLVEELTARKRQIEERLQVIETLERDRRTRVYLLDELAKSVPDYVWLERFEENGQAATIKGWSFTNLAISQFMDSLESKAHVDSVFLRIIKRQEIEGIPALNFELGYRIGSPKEGAGS